MQYQGKEGTLVVRVRFVFSDQIRQQSDRNHNCVLERLSKDPQNKILRRHRYMRI